MLSIKVPPLGESIVEATISRWLKKEGDRVASGETLVELETDKVTVEVPAQKAGVLVRRAKAEGDVVAYERISEGERIVVALNLSARDQAVALPPGRLLLSTKPGHDYVPGMLTADQGVILLADNA